LPPNQNPSPRTTLAQQRVELGAADRDGATVGQEHRTARPFDSGYKVTFRSQISFNQGCDIVHDPTTGSGRFDSQRDKEIAGCGRFPNSDQLIEVRPAASFKASEGSICMMGATHIRQLPVSPRHRIGTSNAHSWLRRGMIVIPEATKGDVGFWRTSGNHLLVVSISQFDPKRPL
jgi:hypothetical protein